MSRKIFNGFTKLNKLKIVLKNKLILLSVENKEKVFEKPIKKTIKIDFCFVKKISVWPKKIGFWCMARQKKKGNTVINVLNATKVLLDNRYTIFLFEDFVFEEDQSLTTLDNSRGGGQRRLFLI